MSGLPVPHASRRYGNKVPSRWTFQHDAKLRRMHAKGVIDRLIADALGFSETQVHNHRKALGLPPCQHARWSADKVETLTSLWNEGITAAKIAARIGGTLTRRAVIGKAHRLKLAPRRAIEVSGPRQPRARRKPKVTAKALPIQKPGPLPPTNPPIRLADIGLFQCRYIKGDPCGPDSLMCGAAVAGEGSYCEFHHELCLTPPPPRKRRSAFIPFAEMGR